MSFSEDRDATGLSGAIGRVLKRLGSLSQLNRGMIVAVVAFAGLYTLIPSHRSLRPVVNARPYIWPEGCPDINYERASSRNENISCDCKNDKYRIDDWLIRGLRDSTRATDHWYRVGHYAINILEGSSIVSNKKCLIMAIQPNFFSENQSIGDRR